VNNSVYEEEMKLFKVKSGIIRKRPSLILSNILHFRLPSLPLLPIPSCIVPTKAT
jgi:hypothetical protein